MVGASLMAVIRIGMNEVESSLGIGLGLGLG